jgi:hypothetical protein
MKKSRKKAVHWTFFEVNEPYPVTKVVIMRTWLIFLLSLSVSLIGCNKKKDEQPANAKPAEKKEPPKPAEPALVEAAGVKPEDEKVECNSGSCTVSVITKTVKTEIEKQKDYEQVTIIFREGLKLVLQDCGQLPWLRQSTFHALPWTRWPHWKNCSNSMNCALRRSNGTTTRTCTSAWDFGGLKDTEIEKLDFYGTKVRDGIVADAEGLVE